MKGSRWLTLGSEEQIFSTPNIEYIVGQTACKTLPFCSEILALSNYIMLTWQMVPGSQLHNFNVQVPVQGSLGMRLKICCTNFILNAVEAWEWGLGTRLCHVPCYLLLIHHREEGYPQPVLWADTPLPVLQEIHPVQNYTIHKQWTMSPWKKVGTSKFTSLYRTYFSQYQETIQLASSTAAYPFFISCCKMFWVRQYCLPSL